MDKRRCEACEKDFEPNPRIKGQRFCSQAACQKERRKREQRERRSRDPDYRENERRAQESRKKKNPHYWREYRLKNPEYADRNRLQQRERDQKRRGQRVFASEGLASEAASDLLATEAASNSADSIVKSGTYELRAVGEGSVGGVLATEASLLVEIHVISAT